MTRRFAARLCRRLAVAAVAGFIVLAAPPAALHSQQPPAAAQAQQQPGNAIAGVEGLNPDSRDPQQQVTVHDSPEALKKLDTAHNMERQHDWNKAAGWYQEVLEQYRDRIVPSHVDSHNVIDQYTSIVLKVHEALARWPADGLAAYRARYEAIAATLLQQAGPDDRDTLNRVYMTYFVTDAGKQAAMRLIDIELEAGDFPGAAWLADRLLNWHPNILVERPRLLYRAALAYHLCGNTTQAEHYLDELQKKFADVTGQVFGKDVNLSQLLASQLQSPPPQAQAASGDSYSMFGGNQSRSLIPQAPGRPGAMLYSIELQPRRKNSPGNSPADDAARGAAAGSGLGIMPVVDRGELFFQDGERIYGVSLESGALLPGWVQTYGVDGKGRYTLVGVTAGKNQQYTITVTPDSVLAVMGQPSPVNIYGNGQNENVNAGTRMVCLDRATGRQRWVISPAVLRKDLGPVEFSGSPVVIGDNVYVIARGGRNAQFEECYVVCFSLSSSDGLDPKTHQSRWNCFISSANVSIVGWDDSGQQTAGTISHMAYASGRLFVLSNLGALAAIDACSGTVLWLTIYPRDAVGDPNAVNFGRPMYPNNGWSPKPWEFNAVMEQDGKLFILPTDSKYLLVYDAGTGLELQRIDREAFGEVLDQQQNGRITTLLAVRGNFIVGGGDKGIVCIRWPDYRPGLTWGKLKERCLEWGTTFAEPTPDYRSAMPDPLRGRAFVTTDSVFVPTEYRLHRVRLGIFTKGGGRAVEGGYPPPNRTWDPLKEGPGNVLVTAENVVLATARSIDVYTDIRVAREKLDREIAANPAAVEPRLRYAETMFAAGDLNLTFQKLSEAVDLLGGLSSLRAGMSRDRLFSDTLTFAQKLAKQKERDDARVQAITRFFDLAKAAASGPSQQVNYRLVRAKFHTDYSEYKSAVQLYQEILNQNDLRLVSIADEDLAKGGMVQAALVAEKAIDRIMKLDAAAGVYEPIEAEARATLAEATQPPPANRDAQKLMEIARRYPNSTKSAAAAMIAAAETCEATGKARLASQVLRQVYMKYAASTDKAVIIEALVRNYLSLPNRLDVAIGRLQKATVDPALAKAALTRPLTLPDGATLAKPTFAELYSALVRLKPQIDSSSVPDLHMPPMPAQPTPAELAAGKRRAKFPPSPFREPTPQTVIDDVTYLVLPPREMQQFSRYDRVVTWNDSGLAIRAACQRDPIFSGKPVIEPPTGMAWFGPRQQKLLVWNARAMAVIDDQPTPAKPATQWQFDLKSLSAIEIVSTETPGTASDANRDNDDAQAQADGGNVRIIRQGNRRILIRGGMVRQILPAAAAAPAVVDNAGGAEQIRQVQPIDDGIAVATSTGRIFCLDPADGHLVWQTRLSSHGVDRLLANPDFVVVRIGEENQVQFVVLDSFDGHIIRKLPAFNAETGQTPVNQALSRDGMLVWTLPDRLCILDLFEPASKPVEAVPDNAGEADTNPGIRNMPGNVAIYAGCDKPDQLLIIDGSILTVEEQGHFFSIRSLQTGKIRRAPDGRGQDVQFHLQTAKNDASEPFTWLRVSGQYVYAISAKTLMAYNMTSPGRDGWKAYLPTDTEPNITDAMVGRDALVLVDTPRGAPNQPGTAVRLSPFTRQQVREESTGLMKESGMGMPRVPVVEASGVQQWQPAEGGIYYLTGDHKLHLLRGLRD